MLVCIRLATMFAQCILCRIPEGFDSVGPITPTNILRNNAKFPFLRESAELSSVYDSQMGAEWFLYDGLLR